MSQKDYNLEIVLALLRNSNHIRGLAKQLGTNQTTIARKVLVLEKINVVDFNFQGKNKVYFIKKSIEAQEYIFIAEHYKSIKILQKYSILRQIFLKIKNHKKIKLSILFGSYAKGISKNNSDIDIYIETQDRKIKKEIEQINMKLNIKLGLYNKTNLLIKEIEKHHVIIKGVEEFYKKNEFFN